MKNRKKAAGGSRLASFYAYLLMLLTLPFAGAASAQSSSLDSEATDIAISITSMPIRTSGENVELAHKWFGDLFGSFIFKPFVSDSNLGSESISLISRAVGFTSILALFLGVIILLYVVIGGALNTAKDGQVLGKSWSSIWIPIRTAMGFGLIMPAAGIGGGVLSVSQMFIIWLLIMGSNTATVLWNKLAGYITSGDPTDAPQVKVGVLPTADMLKMLTCTDIYLKYNASENATSKSNTVVAKSVSDRGIIKYAYSANPGTGVSGSSLSDLITGNNTAVLTFGPSGACGEIKFADINYARTIKGVDVSTPSDEFDGSNRVGYKIQAQKEAESAARSVIGGVLDQLIPIANQMDVIGAKAIFDERQNKKSVSSSGTLGQFEPHRKKFNEIAFSYAQNISPAIHAKMSGNKNITNQFVKDMTHGGWMKAGAWFHEISTFSSMTSNTIAKINSGISESSSRICYPIGDWLSAIFGDNCKDYQEKYDHSVKVVDVMVADVVYETAGDNRRFITAEDEMQAKCGGADGCTPDEGYTKRASTSLAEIIIGVLSSTSTESRSGQLDSPFKATAEIGHTLNQSGLFMWGVGAGVLALSHLHDTSPGTWAGSGFIGGLMMWSFYSIGALVGVIIPLGFTLAYMIPFLPIVTWVLMIAGYFLTVVEATIAAPLAIILMVTPEGEGIAGTRLERAMQLLAIAILKPSLMVIGLITAVGMSAITFGMMNMFFFQVAEYSLHGGVLDFLGTIIIYTMLSMQLCKLIVSVMHKLPDQILEWFSSGMGRSFGEQEAASNMEGGLGQFKHGMSSVSQGGMAAMRRSRRGKGKQPPKSQ